MELGCQVLIGHCGPVYLLQVKEKMMMKNVEGIGSWHNSNNSMNALKPIT